jgi:hypothetical protein
VTFLTSCSSDQPDASRAAKQPSCLSSQPTRLTKPGRHTTEGGCTIHCANLYLANVELQFDVANVARLCGLYPPTLAPKGMLDMPIVFNVRKAVCHESNAMASTLRGGLQKRGKRTVCRRFSIDVCRRRRRWRHPQRITSVITSE